MMIVTPPPDTPKAANFMLRLDCKDCGYHLTVQESMRKWAETVMDKHTAKKHPEKVNVL